MSAHLARAARVLDNSGPAVRWLHIIGMGLCFLWVCFMFIDVLMRYVFDRPYAGGQDEEPQDSESDPEFCDRDLDL